METGKRRTFFSDTGGSVTVEFILWVPILFFWLVGTLVFFDAFKVRGNLTAANSTVADIVSRNSEMDQAYMDLLQVMQTALLPRTSGNGLRISAIQFTESPDTYSVQWSTVAGAANTPMVDSDINVGQLPNMYDGEWILLVESTVPYVPLTTFLGITLQTLSSEVAISPRYESRVVWVP